MLSAVTDGALRYDSEIGRRSSHQLALEKEKELDKFQKALQIDRSAHVHGQAFDDQD